MRKYKFEFKISSSIFVTLLVLAKLRKFLCNDNLFLQNKSSKYKTNFKKARLRLFRCKITLVQVCGQEGDDATFYIYYRDAKNKTNLFSQIQTFEFAIPHSSVSFRAKRLRLRKIVYLSLYGRLDILCLYVYCRAAFCYMYLV